MSKRQTTVKQLIRELQSYGEDTIVVSGQDRHDHCNQIDANKPTVSEAYLTDYGTLINEEEMDSRLEDGDERLPVVIVIGSAPDAR